MIEQIRQYEQHADELYPKLLDAVGVTIDRETGEIVKDKAGSLLVGLGIRDLLFRLECQRERETKLDANAPQDNIARARIWRHIAEASKPMPNPKSGDGSISDISEDWQLNNWLPEGFPKFARPPIRRNCESCGLPWDVCDNHFTKQGQQQSDVHKSWFCFSCWKSPAVRSHYGLEYTACGKCVSCGTPHECAGAGGHVPVNEQDWQCAECFRDGAAVPVVKVPRTYRCRYQACGQSRDANGNRVRGVVERMGEFCSKACKKSFKSIPVPKSVENEALVGV